MYVFYPVQNPGLTTEMAYEFRIGSYTNTRTELFKVTANSWSVVGQADSPIILQEDTLVELWISWVTLDGMRFFCVIPKEKQLS